MSKDKYDINGELFRYDIKSLSSVSFITCLNDLVKEYIHLKYLENMIIHK